MTRISRKDGLASSAYGFVPANRAEVLWSIRFSFNHFPNGRGPIAIDSAAGRLVAAVYASAYERPEADVEPRR
jgi:hypothetical protein